MGQVHLLHSEVLSDIITLDRDYSEKVICTCPPIACCDITGFPLIQAMVFNSPLLLHVPLSVFFLRLVFVLVFFGLLLRLAMQ